MKRNVQQTAALTTEGTNNTQSSVDKQTAQLNDDTVTYQTEPVSSLERLLSISLLY